VAETVSIQDGTDQNQANVPFGNGRPGVSRELNSAMLMCVCAKALQEDIYPAELACVYVPMCLQRHRERDYNDIYIYTYIICDMCV
jgi:hypothetical protein